VERPVLKRRVIPLELFRDQRLVKTVQFGEGRDVGDPVKSSQVYSDQDADELIFLNIDGPNGNFSEFVRTVGRIASCCFVPLIVGGGIREEEHADVLFAAGADKILVNTVAYGHPGVVTQIANKYGSQAVVAGVDYSGNSEALSLLSAGGRKVEKVTLQSHLANLKNAGAGEIMLQSVDRDGKMAGYDLILLREVAAQVSMPLIIAGGAGSFADLVGAFAAGADGAACGSLFNFGDNNPLRAKAFLKNQGVCVKRIG
jgi:cyclase